MRRIATMLPSLLGAVVASTLAMAGADYAPRPPRYADRGAAPIKVPVLPPKGGKRARRRRAHLTPTDG